MNIIIYYKSTEVKTMDNSEKSSKTIIKITKGYYPINGIFNILVIVKNYLTQFFQSSYHLTSWSLCPVT